MLCWVLLLCKTQTIHPMDHWWIEGCPRQIVSHCLCVIEVYSFCVRISHVHSWMHLWRYCPKGPWVSVYKKCATLMVMTLSQFNQHHPAPTFLNQQLQQQLHIYGNPHVAEWPFQLKCLQKKIWLLWCFHLYFSAMFDLWVSDCLSTVINYHKGCPKLKIWAGGIPFVRSTLATGPYAREMVGGWPGNGRGLDGKW